MAIVFWWSELAPPPPKASLTRLPTPPKTAKTIMGIDSRSFYQADLWIQTIDEETYGFILNLDAGEYAWQAGIPLPKNFSDRPCEPTVLHFIETSAAQIIDCRTVHPSGEWGPAPIVSFAITGEGNLWKLEEEQTGQSVFFKIFFLPSFCVFGLAGFVLGLIIVLTRKIFFAVIGRRQSSH